MVVSHSRRNVTKTGVKYTISKQASQERFIVICVCTCECKCPRMTEEGVESPGVTGSCESPSIGAACLFSEGAVNTLNQPCPRFFYLDLSCLKGVVPLTGNRRTNKLGGRWTHITFSVSTEPEVHTGIGASSEQPLSCAIMEVPRRPPHSYQLGA